MQVAIGNRPLDPEQFWHRDVAPLVSDVPTPDGKFDLGDVLLITRKAPGIARQEGLRDQYADRKKSGGILRARNKSVFWRELRGL